MDLEDTVRKYREELFPQYRQFTLKLEGLLRELIEPLGVGEFILESRPKAPDHFRRKISDPEKHYTDPLTEVTDFSGLRVIVQRINDAEQVISLVEREFVVDAEKSWYKKDHLEVDRLGYLTEAQLIVSLTAQRAGLTEWSSFRTLNAEIQVRTILQHAWDVISRRYDYKVEVDVPTEVRRKLFRLSALFELGDDQLEQFAVEAGKIIQAYQKSIQMGDQRMEINVDSLRAYVSSSPEVEYWNNFLRTDDDIGHRVDTWGDLSRDVRMARFFGLRYIQDIDSTLKSAHGWGEAFFRRFYLDHFSGPGRSPHKVMTVVNGVVGYLMVASYAERLDARTLSKEFGYGDNQFAQSVLDLAGESKQGKSGV